MADRSILSPQYANDLNGLFNGSGTIDTGNISCAKLSLTGNTPGYVTSLTTDLANSVNINTPLTGGITFNATNISVPPATIGLNSVGGVSSLDCSTAFTVPTLNINNAAGVQQSTLAEVGNGVAAIYNKDTASLYPTAVLQLVNATNQSCDLGVSTSGAFEVGIDATGTVSCAEVSLTGNTPGYVTSLTTDLANSVNINVPLSGGITFNATNISVPEASIFLESSDGVSSLSCTTNFSALTFSGGIGCLNQSISIPSISILGTYTVNMTIPNFIGSASSIYVASLNESSLVSITSTIGVSYTGVSGTGTEVIVVITNPSSAPAGGFSAAYDAYVNIIAMNPPVL